MAEDHSQFSTAVSDALLALSSFHASIVLSSTNVSGLGGFLFIGLAACCGVQRFCMKHPDEKSISRHTYLSWLASVLGLSCIAAAYYRSQGIPIVANAHIACAIAVVMLRSQLSENVLHVATEIVSSGAVVSTLLLSLLMFNPFGIIGAMVYAVAGLVIGTEGDLYGILRVDLFHYALVLGNIALMMGLTHEPSPVYYRPSPST